MPDFNSRAFSKAIKSSPRSVAQIAIAAGVTSDCIRKLMKGSRKEPRYSTVLKIASAIDCDSKEFYQEAVNA